MSIYEHFRPEEAIFVDKVLEWKEAAEFYHNSKLTDFLDPREQNIIRSVVGNDSEVAVNFYGGASDVERKRAIICPSYLTPEEDDFSLHILSITYASKYYTIEHRQVLGTLMSLGLKREKFGDILLQDNQIHIVVAEEVASYIQSNLQMIGKASVSVSSIFPSDLILVKDAWAEKSGTVSTLRLDVLAAEMFHVSRQKLQLLIKSGSVKVNWKVTQQPSFECREGDVISARGYGRSKLIGIEGKSKRDKWRIIFGLRN
ncbi:RNA-binding protein [Ectobacillus polymachus]|uniref:YlmH family RNA-binding protein n=1 Tax=Ectobacillus polymachus TaxID=1508806 RepID=UPI003A848F4A